MTKDAVPGPAPPPASRPVRAPRKQLALPMANAHDARMHRRRHFLMTALAAAAPVLRAQDGQRRSKYSEQAAEVPLFDYPAFAAWTLYLEKEPPADLGAALKEIAGEVGWKGGLPEKPTAETPAPWLFADRAEAQLKERPLPKAEELAASADGIDKDGLAKLAAARHAASLVLLNGRADALRHNRQAHVVALRMARSLGAWIGDDFTGRFHSADAFEAGLLTPWAEDGFPVMPRVTVALALGSEAPWEMATSGMIKFGLPELVIRKLPDGGTDRCRLLLGLVAQALIEGTAPGADGSLALTLDALRTKAALPPETDFGMGATRRSTLTLRPAKGSAAEGRRRFWEVTFPGEAGESEPLRCAAALRACFGEPAPRSS